MGIIRRILTDLKAPVDIANAFDKNGIRSFNDFWLRSKDVSTIQGLNPDLLNKLTAHARLSSVSQDVELNGKLIEAGITSKTLLANYDDASLENLFHEEFPTVNNIKKAGQVYMTSAKTMFLNAAVDLSPVNKGNLLYDRSHYPNELKNTLYQDPQFYSNCSSVLSPLSYLIDLQSFLIECFSDTFPSQDSLDKKFYRSFGDILNNCTAMTENLHQIEIVNEVIENYIYSKSAGLTRENLYAEFRKSGGYPKPDVLERTFNLYLTQIGTSRKEIQEAFTAATSTPPDRSKLNGLVKRLGLPIDALKTLNIGDPANITIVILDSLLGLVRDSKTSGINPIDPTQQQAYKDAMELADKAIDKVKTSILPDFRENLIYKALSVDPSITSSKKLGKYLHLDTFTDASAMTTRVDSAIEALQSFVLSYQMGREKDVKLSANMPQEDFEARLRWLRSYNLWHAVQMVFFYPENFLLPGARRNITPQFYALIETIKQDGTPGGVQKAITQYQRSVPTSPGYGIYESIIFAACQFRDLVVVLGRDGDYNYIIGAINENGEWTGWTSTNITVKGYQKEQIAGMIAWNNSIYIFSIEKVDDNNYNLCYYRATKTDFGFEFSSKNSSPLPRGLSYTQYVGFIPTRNKLFIYTGDYKDKKYRIVIQSLEANGYIEIVKHFKDTYDSYPNMHGLGKINKKHYVVVGNPSLNPKLLIFDSTNNFQMTSYDLPKITLYDTSQSLLYGTDLVGTIKGTTLYILMNSVEEGLKRKNLLVIVDPQMKITSVELDNVEHYGFIQYIEWIDDSLYVVGGQKVVIIYPPNSSNNPTSTWICSSSFTLYSSLPDYMLDRPESEDGEPQFFARYRQEQTNAFKDIKPHDFDFVYLKEYYHFLPLTAAYYLNQNKYFQEADEWLRLLYNPLSGSDPIIYININNADIDNDINKSLRWLLDPFNPYFVASMRRGAFLRHAIYQYVGNLLDWADEEFASDTIDSINRARMLYEMADDVLESSGISDNICNRLFVNLRANINSAFGVKESSILVPLLQPLQHNARVKTEDLIAIRDTLSEPDTFENKLSKCKLKFDEIMTRSAYSWNPGSAFFNTKKDSELQLQELEDIYEKIKVSKTEAEGNDCSLIPNSIVRTPEALVAINIIDNIRSKARSNFCIPGNPQLDVLKDRIGSNLDKIRTCRNFAGIPRTMRMQGASVNTLTAFPLNPPPLYRFSYLIEQARYYTQVSKQFEDDMLSSFKEGDQERYNLLKARQNLSISNQHLILQSLKVTQSKDEVKLAQQQTNKARSAKEHYFSLMTNRYSENEKQILKNLYKASFWSQKLANVYEKYLAENDSSIEETENSWDLEAFASAKSMKAQWLITAASFERRKEEWEYLLGLAYHDCTIGEETISIANDSLAISETEQKITQIQNDQDREILSFLGEKFTNVVLWDWMAQVIRKYYRNHLNMATSIARIAQDSLAFERQEKLTFIAPYYSNNEKKDLLVAEQLLNDINILDEHRLVTEKRRKEITKIISLSTMVPLEFNQLCKEGRITFATPMKWFDRDFPGHYMRLIKNISLNVYGLIPSSESVHFTLSNNGISRVVVGPPFKDSIVITRQPESIAVSTANEGTGLFQFYMSDSIMLPFEGSGVDTIWYLEMPMASNRFDYDMLADVQMVIRYTALDAPDYRDQVIKALGDTISSSTPFRLRNNFPDAWYFLNNPIFIEDSANYGYGPKQITPPYELQFELDQAYFLPNEMMDKLIRINLVMIQDMPIKVPIEIQFKPDGSMDEFFLESDYYWDSGDPISGGGPISVSSFTFKRNSAGSQWQKAVTPMETLKPFGKWILRIRNGGTKIDTGQSIDPKIYPGLFSNEPPAYGKYNILILNWLKDIMFVCTYEAKVRY